MSSAPKSTVQLTRELLEAEGWTVDLVERRIPHRASKTKDLFGFADLLAVKAGEPGALFVQATTMENLQARVDKIRAEPRARTVLLSGNRIVAFGWRLSPAPPGSRSLWAERRRWIQIAELAEPVTTELPPLPPRKA